MTSFLSDNVVKVDICEAFSSFRLFILLKTKLFTHKYRTRFTGLLLFGRKRVIYKLDFLVFDL